MACPECLAVPGEMCVTIAPTHVEAERTPAGYFKNGGRPGFSDKSQVGRTAKRPHNGRGRAYYHAHLPEPERELTWTGRLRSFKSRDHRYQIEQDWSDARAFLDQSERHQVYRVYVRVYGQAKRWFRVGPVVESLDEAKAAAQAHNVDTGFAVCSCGSREFVATFGHEQTCQLA